MLALLMSAPAIGAGLDVSAAVQACASTERLMLADVSSANTFNRNLKKEKDPNAPPPEDGYHDPENESTHILQAPKDAYVKQPTTKNNKQDEKKKAIDEKKLSPRWDRINSN